MTGTCFLCSNAEEWKDDQFAFEGTVAAVPLSLVVDVDKKFVDNKLMFF